MIIASDHMLEIYQLMVAIEHSDLQFLIEYLKRRPDIDAYIQMPQCIAAWLG